MSNKEMPILLLTGYLGSGKTTLVNRILKNEKGIRFAVIVNDIGEVNIDATLIQQGGMVGKKDDSLVALQNGCICCTLKTDLMQQIVEIMKMDKFDYIVIEASGICEPEPIAQTITSMKAIGGVYTEFGTPRLDCIVTVVDALRMVDEFGCGENLERKDLEEEDIENLIIQQIEFCNILLLNKVADVEPEALEKVKRIIREIQLKAKIVECNYADVDIESLLNTNIFDFRQTESGAGWLRGLEGDVVESEEGHHHEHEGHHHHHHDHEGGEVEEYGIGTFVYYRRPAFDINKFDWFISKRLPKSVIRAKGLCYFSNNTDMSCLFEQAGKQISLREVGRWFATAPEEELIQMMRQDPTIMKDWDAHYGDRMQKIVFIGQNMDKEQICRDLDTCLDE
ncbi:MAG: GTP-binding protein [Bacteroides sp.]|nr:GTP-binding protein [Bacteroidales bacterium]MCI7462189.1 GTP-binding protein [Bacteroides sp.]MDD6150191.1 GTP-binding protein [Bacteroides sp.]MDY2972835.1 GTP-binding protein [Candidatus Cryptobacteroides sp.]MED9900748.1 GTP-binding protein [Bacteroidales bacterium]